jgi:F0F1-type ATP synthase membrane subunit b/b'
MIDSIFKILNFIVFLAAVIYYVRKNIIGSIKNQLLRKKGENEDLIQQGVLARDEYSSLQGQLNYQENMYKTLEDKVAAWRTKIHSDHEHTKKECERYEQALRERSRAQMEYWCTLSVGKKIMPEVFKEARNELEKLFTDPQEIYSYDKKALEALKKSD